MNELEPFKCNFNSVILHQQLDGFWQGVKELDLGNQEMVWPGLHEVYAFDLTPQPLQPSFNTPGQEVPFLSTVLRQGLISVVFGILTMSISSLSYEEIVQMNIFPKGSTEEDVEAWTNQYNNLCLLHLNLSNYIEHPTLWSLQSLNLLQAAWISPKAVSPNGINTSTALRLAVSMGLNRLGSAADDAESMQASTNAGDTTDDVTEVSGAEEALGSNVSGPTYGVTIASFEEGNLALRELGRKLWNVFVTTEYITGSHAHQFYSINDNMNQTSPPSPIDDENILSKRAIGLLLNGKRNKTPSKNAFLGCFLQIAKAGKLQTDLELSKGSPMAYKDLLEVDKAFQSALKYFPSYLCFSSNSPLSLDFDDNFHHRQYDRSHSFKTIVLQKIILQEQFQFRILRLHRLYIGKGLKDFNYRYSLKSCINAAKVIIESRRELERIGTTIRKVRALQSHLLHAALVIHLILLYHVDRQREAVVGSDSAGCPSPSKEGNNKNDDFVLQDFTGHVQLLKTAVEYLRIGADFNGWLAKGLEKLDAFLLEVSPPSPRQSAADVLLSIPSLSSSTWPSDTTTHSSNLFPTDFWSLESLFPDYATNSIDLVDALEKVVWS